MDKTQRGKGIRVKGVLGWKAGKRGRKGRKKKNPAPGGRWRRGKKQTKVKIKSHS